MENPEKYDVIVVGAGNGGLAAGAFAAKRGLKTLIFEKHNLPGGAVSSFRRGRFEFEPSLHEMCEVGAEENPGNTRRLFKEMDADVSFAHDGNLYTAICTDPDEKFTIKIPAGIENFCDAIEKQAPRKGKRVRKFLEYEKNALDTSMKLDQRKVSFKDIPEIMNLFRMLSVSSDFFMDLLRIPKKVQHMITPYWTYVGEPTSTMCPFMMGMMDYCYALDGAGVPSMFSHEFSVAIDHSIRKHGGKIFYNSPVTKILVNKKRAYGVVANGKEYYADHIICNCFPNDVFGHLMEKKYVPLSEIIKINARKIALSFVNVHLGLNKSVEELGIEDYSTFIFKHGDSTKQYKECFGVGNFGFVIANALNIIIPECSPKGTTHFSITTAVYGDEWSKVKPEDYKKTKLQVAEKMIAYFEESTGIKIRPYIEEMEVATPVTYSRYLGTPNGTPYGYQASNWDGIFLRTMYQNQERSVKGLSFVGAHTQYSVGYNQTYKSGQNAIEEIYGKEN